MELASSYKYSEALELVNKYKAKKLTVTKFTLKNKYGLKPKDIETLHYIEVENPIYKSAGLMKLYLRAEAHRLSLKKKRAKENKKTK